jgi:uncharacterized surface protein with fasciclin (FAS1) repeats
MRQSYIALGAATFLLAACGGTTEERAATGGVGGAVVGGPVGAVVGGAAGGAAMDEGVDEKIGEARAGESPASGVDVLDEIKSWKEFSTFSEAIEATDLKGTLAGDGPVTVFAATDAAFAQLPQGAVDKLMTQENRAELETLLRHHVVDGKRLASNAIPQRIDPMGGGEITATMSGGRLILKSAGEDDNKSARVVSDIPADNGVIHVIDSVLMTKRRSGPPGWAAAWLNLLAAGQGVTGAGPAVTIGELTSVLLAIGGGMLEPVTGATRFDIAEQLEAMAADA